MKINHIVKPSCNCDHIEIECYDLQKDLTNLPYFSLSPPTPIPTSFPFPPQCSVSCGRGTKQREIECVYQNQTKIEEEHCSHLSRPRTQKACRVRGCPSWKANRWREVCLLFSPSPLTHKIAWVPSGRLLTVTPASS